MTWKSVSEKYRLIKIYNFGGFVSNILFLKNWVKWFFLKIWKYISITGNV